MLKNKSLGGIVYSGTAGGCTVRNTRIRCESSRVEAGINIRSNRGRSVFEGVSITGGADCPAIRASHTAVVRDSCIAMPNAPGDGLVGAIAEATGLSSESCPLPKNNGPQTATRRLRGASRGVPTKTKLDDSKVPNVSFRRTLNAAGDLGLQPGDRVDDVLSDALRPGTMVEFPPGEYVFGDTIDLGGRNVGIRGLGDSRSAVSFVPPKGGSQQFADINGGDGVLIENLTIDAREDWQTSTAGIQGIANDRLLIRNVEMGGWYPADSADLSIGLSNPDGVGLVDKWVRMGPGRFYPYGSGASESAGSSKLTAFVGRGNKGRLTFRGLEIANSSESGIYAGKSHGPIEILDSYFENCAHSAIRVTGADSRIANCTIVMSFEDEFWNSRNQYRGIRRRTDVPLRRGIWQQSADVRKSGALVEDCDIYIGPDVPGIAGILMGSDTGGAIITNTRIENNMRADRASILAPTAGREAASPLRVGIEGCSLTGTSPSWAVEIDGRSGSYLRETCVAMPNSRGITGIPGDRIDVSDGECAPPDTSVPARTSSLREPSRGGDSGVAAAIQAVLLTVLLTLGAVAALLVGLAILFYLLYRMLTQ
jgi:hypothetical protein